MSLYAVYGSELHLILPDDFADAVIRAQTHYNESTEMWETTRWHMPSKDRDAWDAYADLMNQLIKINGGTLELPNEVKDAPILVKLHYIGES